MLGGISARRRGLLLVLIATFLWSSAGFFARLIDHVDLWTMLGWRALFGGLCMLAAAVVEWHRGILGPRFGLVPLAAPLIALAAIAMSAYVAALKTTTVAEVMVIYATLPFVAAGLGFVLGGERTTRRTLIAAAVAFAGIVVMVASALGTGRLLGQFISFVMTFAFALMIVLQRRNPQMSMTSINAFGALIAAGFGFSLSPHPASSWFELSVLAAFGLTTVCVAFFLFMEGAKHIPAAEAGLISMLDVVLAPFWVFLAFGERPGPLAVFGGALVMGALIWRLAPDIGTLRKASSVRSIKVN
jgi:drug/metabolite transporter (DMT)-like permease